jgi:hypothetical protein
MKLVEVLLVRSVLDTAAAAHFLVQGRWKHAKAVGGAYSDFIKMRPAFKIKRKNNLDKTIQTNIPQLYKGSMLFDFYFRRKRRYSDIIQ